MLPVQVWPTSYPPPLIFDITIHHFNHHHMKLIITTLSLLLCTIIGAAQSTSAKLTANKCQGTTVKKEPCKSTIIMKDGYCRSHSPNAIRCGANTSSNKPCKVVVDTKGEKCRFHQPKTKP